MLFGMFNKPAWLCLCYTLLWLASPLPGLAAPSDTPTCGPIADPDDPAKLIYHCYAMLNQPDVNDVTVSAACSPNRHWRID